MGFYNCLVILVQTKGVYVNVQGREIVLFKKEQEDYISLTDIAKVRDIENPSQINIIWEQA